MRKVLLLAFGLFAFGIMAMTALVMNPTATSPAAAGGSVLAALAAASEEGQADPLLCGPAGTVPASASGAQVAALAAARAGFKGQDLVTAVAVAGAESGWRPDATNLNTNGSLDLGMWQINTVHAGILATGDWKDPNDNALMAHQVWAESGGRWTPWVTFNTGAYRIHLATAVAAVNGSGAAAAQPCTGAGGTGPWRYPLQGRYPITSPFGPRNLGDGTHSGTDIGAPCGTPVFAASAGKVITATMFPPGSGGLESYGNVVMIDHGGGIESRYGHQSALLVQAGQTVAAGARIGTSGNTGHSFGCHLHFELQRDGVAFNAEPWMAARGAPLR